MMKMEMKRLELGLKERGKIAWIGKGLESWIGREIDLDWRETRLGLGGQKDLD